MTVLSVLFMKNRNKSFILLNYENLRFFKFASNNIIGNITNTNGPAIYLDDIMLISLVNINVGGNKASIKVIIHKGNMNGLLFFTPDSFFNIRSSNITAIFKYVMNDKIHTNINNDSGC